MNELLNHGICLLINFFEEQASQQTLFLLLEILEVNKIDWEFEGRQI
jgi:hypothetical protein